MNRAEKAIHAFEEAYKRAPQSLQELADFDGTEAYPYLTGLYAFDEKDCLEREFKHFLQGESEDYVIVATERYYYRITYLQDNKLDRQIIALINGTAFLMFLVVLAVLFYVRRKILLPFSDFSELPYELAKGNLAVPLKENKNRFFGRFVWGMDLLREKLEDNKAREAVGQIRNYYVEKMELNQIRFTIGPYSNCLVRGDQDRLVEVLQPFRKRASPYF